MNYAENLVLEITANTNKLSGSFKKIGAEAQAVGTKAQGIFSKIPTAMSGAFGQVGGLIGGTVGQVAGLGTAMGTATVATTALAGAGIAASAALLPITAIVGTIVGAFALMNAGADAYAAKAKGFELLNASLGGNADKMKNLVTIADDLQQKTIYTGDSISKAFADTTIKIGQMSESSYKAYADVLVGYASRTGTSIEAAEKAITQGLLGRDVALKQQGITLDKNATKEEKILSLQKQLAINTAQASKEAETAAGQWKRLGNNWDDLIAQFGGAGESFGLMSGLWKMLADAVSNFSGFLVKNEETINKWITVAKAAWSIFGDYIGLIFANAGKVIGFAVKTFVSYVKWLYDTWTSIFKAIGSAWDALTSGMGESMGGASKMIDGIWKGITDFIADRIKVILGLIGAMLDKFKFLENVGLPVGKWKADIDKARKAMSGDMIRGVVKDIGDQTAKGIQAAGDYISEKIEKSKVKANWTKGMANLNKDPQKPATGGASAKPATGGASAKSEVGISATDLEAVYNLKKQIAKIDQEIFNTQDKARKLELEREKAMLSQVGMIDLEMARTTEESKLLELTYERQDVLDNINTTYQNGMQTLRESAELNERSQRAKLLENQWAEELKQKQFEIDEQIKNTTDEQAKKLLEEKKAQLEAKQWFEQKLAFYQQEAQAELDKANNIMGTKLNMDEMKIVQDAIVTGNYAQLEALGLTNEQLEAIRDGSLEGVLDKTLKIASRSADFKRNVDASTGACSGLNDALGDVGKMAEDIGKSLGDAIGQAIETGEFDLKKFASGTLQKVLDMVLNMVGSMAGLGGGGGGIGNLLGGLFKFSTGGYVDGAGTGLSDSIPAALSKGEFVVSKEKVQRYKPMIDIIDQGSSIQMPKINGFSTGGYTSSIPKSSAGILGRQQPNINQDNRISFNIDAVDGDSIKRFLTSPTARSIISQQSLGEMRKQSNMQFNRSTIE